MIPMAKVKRPTTITASRPAHRKLCVTNAYRGTGTNRGLSGTTLQTIFLYRDVDNELVVNFMVAGSPRLGPLRD
jgi:hypothetical protein